MKLNIGASALARCFEESRASPYLSWLRYNTAMAKWYLRIIGVFFLLVSVSLVADYVQFGFRPETMHKIFHVLVGLIVVRYGWNDPRWWRPFAIANGGFFTFVGLFGWLFPDFGGLDAFNRLDTVLHSFVGLSGLVAGWWDKGTKVSGTFSAGSSASR